MSEPITAATEEMKQATAAPEPTKMYEYKTIIIYDDKVNETIISIQPPQVSPARMLHFLLMDRLIVRNIDKIRGWSTEQLGEIVPNHNRIILSEK
jgi:hypothetical protein